MSAPVFLHSKPSICSSVCSFCHTHGLYRNRSYTGWSELFHFNSIKRPQTSASLSNSEKPSSSSSSSFSPKPSAPSLPSSSVDAAAAEDGSSTSSSGYLKSGSLAVALLSLTYTTLTKVKISPVVYVLASNPTFISGVLAWFIAQSTKVVVNLLVKKKRWDVSMFFASGGMPSSHTALCTALTTSVALCHGVADSLFPVCVGFTSIVMYDAIGVRRHAGMQAQVLNIIMDDLFQGHPVRQRKLKELLGHTPSQVLVGALLGMVVAYISYHGCLVVT